MKPKGWQEECLQYCREVTVADIYSKEKRSEIMKAIRGKDTKPEVRMRKLVSKLTHPLGIRYRLNNRSVFGCPDLTFASRKVAVFVDGDFWHGGHKAKLDRLSPFWRAKILRNMQRDRDVNERLTAEGWKVIRVWEHEVMKCPEAAVRSILQAVTKSDKNVKKNKH